MVLTNLQIKVVGELKTGTSKATGVTWASRNIVLGFQDEDGRDNYISCRCGENVWAANGAALAVNDIVTARLLFYTRNYSSGFVGNDITILDIKKV